MAEEEGPNPDNIKATSNAMEELNKIAEQMAAQNADTIASVRELTEEFSRMAETLTESSIQTSRIAQQAFREMSDSARDASRSTSNARDSVNAWAKSGEGAMAQLAKKFGVVEDANSTFIGFASNVMSGSISLKSLKAGLMASFAPFEVAVSIANKFVHAMKDLAMATDAAIAKLNKATGAGTQFAAEIASMSPHMAAANVSVTELTDTYSDLAQNFLAFNKLNDQQRINLVETTAILNELGVAGETTSDNFNILMTSFKMTQEEASRFQREMFVIAQESMIPPEVMAAGFKQAIPQLAAFGKQATSVYAKLAVNAKAAGMSTQEVLNITEKFDRFDTAAESVGKLNAILGGPYLSTTRMIRETDPTERIRMLSDAAADAGKSFDSMQYFERKALAAAMGLQDVNQLALVMNNQFDLLAPNVERSASEITELAKKTAEFNSIMDTLKNTFMSLVANLAPVVTGIKNVVGGFQNLMFKYPAIKGVLAGLTIAVTALVASLAGGPAGVTIGIVIAGLIVTFSILLSMVGALKRAFNEASAVTFFFSAAVVIAFAPVFIIFGIIYGAVKLLIGTIRYLYNAMQPVFDALGEFIDHINTVLEPTMEAMREQFSSLSEELSNLYDVFEMLAGDLIRDLMPALKVIGFVIGAVLVGAIYVLVEGIRIAALGLTKIIKVVTFLFQVIRPLAAIIREITTTGRPAVAFFKGFFSEANKGASYFESLANGIEKFLETLLKAASISIDLDYFNISGLDQFQASIEPVANFIATLPNVFTRVSNAFTNATSGLSIFNTVLAGIQFTIEVIIGLIPKMVNAMATIQDLKVPSYDAIAESVGIDPKTANAAANIATAGSDAAEAAYNADFTNFKEAIKEMSKETTVIIKAADGLFDFVEASAQAAGKTAVKTVIKQTTGLPVIP